MAPDQVDKCSLWQLAACVDGWNNVHGAQKEPEPMSAKEYDEMIERNADFISTAMH